MNNETVTSSLSPSSFRSVGGDSGHMSASAKKHAGNGPPNLTPNAIVKVKRADGRVVTGKLIDLAGWTRSGFDIVEYEVLAEGSAAA